MTPPVASFIVTATDCFYNDSIWLLVQGHRGSLLLLLSTTLGNQIVPGVNK
jgi:hypothetical protein